MTIRPRLGRQLVVGPDGQSVGQVARPTQALLDLPERAVQFGTGALLRGLVDAILDEANRRGHFGGRVVAIGSTGSGRDEIINRQDGLFTLVALGLESGSSGRDCRVIGAVSRAINASHEWEAVLQCARNPLLEVIFSNTTEVGIALDDGDAADAGALVPRSFPAKLTRFLDERARTFAYSPDKGVVVVPCELIERNGNALRDIVLVLAERWMLGPEFIRWLTQSVHFCNTLVDRIVSGAPEPNEQKRLEVEFGYSDEMITICEPYRLLAIEGDEKLRARLRFARRDLGAIIVDDIRPYRERKVRLLNGGHTVLASLALLAGCETVREAVEHEVLGQFLRRAMLDELVPSLDVPGAAAFAGEVLERFSNPYVRHDLLDITLHGGTKMRVRVVPSILDYAARAGHAPPCVALGFAAYLLFARGDRHDRHGAPKVTAPQDVVGERLRLKWSSFGDAGRRSPTQLVRAVCADDELWGADLTAVTGFSELVADHLLRLDRDGPLAAVEAVLASVEQSRAHALT